MASAPLGYLLRSVGLRYVDFFSLLTLEPQNPTLNPTLTRARYVDFFSLDVEGSEAQVHAAMGGTEP